MWDKLKQIWKIRELRTSILFVVALLIVFRLAAHIPIPGVDPVALRRLFDSYQILGLLNLFSGGAMENFSVVALGVGPYITASIILQLLTMVIPRLEEITKEGEAGQRKINQWTRLLTVPLAVLQGWATVVLLQQSGGAQGGGQILGTLTPLRLATILATLTAGTVFLMWLGELISERKVGNGISLLIFAGIVSGLPTAALQVLSTYSSADLPMIISFIAVALVTTATVVYITEAQRNIPVSYARRVRGMRVYGGVNTHLPLRVNQAGMIPIIFAVSVVLFPTMVAQFLQFARSPALRNVGLKIAELFNNQLIYGIIFFLLVVGFTYFYTAIIFHPDKIAENLQKQGGFIPGIRPGKPTSEYLGNVSQRIILAGALFLGLIAVLPIGLQAFTGLQALTISGSSLLIVVSVVIETTKQIESQLTMRDYEGL